MQTHRQHVHAQTCAQTHIMQTYEDTHLKYLHHYERLMLQTLNLKKRKQQLFIWCNSNTHTQTQLSISLTQAAVAKILPQTDVAELVGSDPSYLQSDCCIITLQIQRTADRVNL